MEEKLSDPKISDDTIIHLLEELSTKEIPTILLKAIQYQRLKVVDYLLRKGLTLAIAHGDFALIDLLLRHGAKVTSDLMPDHFVEKPPKELRPIEPGIQSILNQNYQLPSKVQHTLFEINHLNSHFSY